MCGGGLRPTILVGTGELEIGVVSNMDGKGFGLRPNIYGKGSSLDITEGFREARRRVVWWRTNQGI